MSDSSSDSEDDNVKRFMEAVDTTLINDAMFQSKPKDDNDIDKTDSKKEAPVKPTVDCPKSNRYLVEDENVFQSDLNVTDSMKKFVGKKLSALIESKISFVDVDDQKVTDGKEKTFNKEYGVKLLRDFDVPLKITIDDQESSLITRKNYQPIKRRQPEADTTTEKTKIELAAIDVESATHKLTKCWSNRPKAQVFDYKGKGPSFVLQEPADEFLKMKRKNNWTDSKIAAFRKKSKTKSKV